MTLLLIGNSSNSSASKKSRMSASNPDLLRSMTFQEDHFQCHPGEEASPQGNTPRPVTRDGPLPPFKRSRSSSARRSFHKVTSVMLRRPADKLKGETAPWVLMRNSGGSVTDSSSRKGSFGWHKVTDDMSDKSCDRSYDNIELKDLSGSRDTALTSVEI